MNTISLCMIVRDDLQNLKNLILSVKQFVDEICIVDTGSTDGTADYAKEIADKFISTKEFLDEEGLMTDFAAARQKSFDMSTCEWQMWLDSDDVLIGGEHIKSILDKVVHQENEAISLDMEYLYTWDKTTGKCNQRFYRERIVRKQDGWLWERPVHEYLSVKPKKENRIPIKSVVIEVHHRGLPKAGKTNRNRKILQKMWTNDKWKNDITAYYLGNEAEGRKEITKALEWYQICLETHNRDNENHWKSEAAFHAFCCCYNNNMWLEAQNWIEKSIVIDTITCYPYFSIALIESAYAKWQEAYSAAITAMSMQDGIFTNPMIKQFDLPFIAGYAAMKLGLKDEAIKNLSLALKAKPNQSKIMNYLIDLQISET